MDNSYQLTITITISRLTSYNLFCVTTGGGDATRGGSCLSLDICVVDVGEAEPPSIFEPDGDTGLQRNSCTSSAGSEGPRSC